MTTLYRLELDQTDVNCGMSYVFQLADGRFIILDGGYFTPGEDDRLFGFMKQKAVGKPHIAAWYFSHGHQDHIGNFIQFMRKYHAHVEIDNLLYNFQPIDFSSVAGDWKSSDQATVQAFYETLDDYLPGVNKAITRTGDVFTFGEMKLEVLYTHEDPCAERRFFNDCSTVLRTTVGDCRILWLADVGKKAAGVLLRKPDELQCDIVQVAHHGIDDYENLCDVYAATGAKVALWPTPDYGMASRKNQTVNHYLLHNLSIREHLVSGYGMVALPLPYALGTAIKSPKTLALDKQPSPEDGFGQAIAGNSTFRYMIPDAVNT